VSDPDAPEELSTTADEPPAGVLDELQDAFGASVGIAPPPPPRPLPPPQQAPSTADDVAPSIVVESLVPEATRRSQRRSRREAKREARLEAKRVAQLEKQERKAAKKSRHQAQGDLDAAVQPDLGEEGVRIIPGVGAAAHDPAGPGTATASAPASVDPASAEVKPTVAIDDDGRPDAVSLEGELGSGGSATATSDAGAQHRSTVFIDDRGPGTGEIVPIDVATSAARMEPRLRERRVAVKRAAGRKRLKWAAILCVVAGLVVGGLAVLGSGLFSITTVDVEGAVYSRGEALDAVVNQLEGANVLRVDTDDAERALEAIPWVDDARVTTDFPHGATIEIRERRPIIAYQATDGRFRVLDTRGRVLDVIAGQPVAYLPLTVEEGAALDAGDLAPRGYRNAAALVSALTPQMRQRATAVSTDRNATELSLILDDQIEVRFGAAEDLQDKLVRLQTALTNPNPQLAATELIDVSTEDLIVR
jgi:cell division protein FtsQ